MSRGYFFRISDVPRGKKQRKSEFIANRVTCSHAINISYRYLRLVFRVLNCTASCREHAIAHVAFVVDVWCVRRWFRERFSKPFIDTYIFIVLSFRVLARNHSAAAKVAVKIAVIIISERRERGSCERAHV